MAKSNGSGEMRLNGHGNPCYVCKKACNNTCSRCGEFYCSKQCQVNDWLNHKHVCFAMPELLMGTPSSGQRNENNSRSRNNNRNVVQNGLNKRNDSNKHQTPAQQSAESPPTAPKGFSFAYEPKNNESVILTWVKQANSYYIRSINSNAEYMKNAKDFDDYGKTGKKLMGLPQKNDLVLVPYDRMFVRAVVLTVESESKINVALADIGRKFHTSLHNIRQLSDNELCSRKRFNFKLHLAHIPNNMDRDSYSNLLNFVRNQTVFTLQFDGNDWTSATNFKLLKKDNGLPIEIAVLGENVASKNAEGGKKNVVAKNAEGKKKNAAAKNAEGEGEQVAAKNAEGEGEKVAANNAKGEGEKVAANNAKGEEEKVAVKNTEGALSPESKTATNTRKVATQENTSQSNENKNVVLSKKFWMADLTFEALPEVADLLILDNSLIATGCVSAISNDNLSKLTKLTFRSCEYGNSIDEKYKPEPDELCLVKSDEEWYRAVYAAPRFSLIDYGCTEDIDERNVRKFPPELADPCYTFFCNVEGFASESMERYKDALKVYSKHFQCICKRVDGETNEYDVKFPLV